MAEAYIRIGLNVLGAYTIYFMILTGPKDDNESPVDQTMNFTALLILLELDNILGGIFQKDIDSFDIKFDQDPLNLEQDFNRAANFVQERAEVFRIQLKVEIFFWLALNLFLFAGLFFLPAMLSFYVLVPVQ